MRTLLSKSAASGLMSTKGGSMENMWKYEMKDKDSHRTLAEREGFVSEEDALLQGKMDADVDNIKNYYIHTIQVPL